ncbi:unnamed protein product [Dibothriocephalus latus]|uniref:Uncharacterized protein n=1 Tax=Dibothriocephalus latus TaxID=60516 RepID=A0A3P7PF55_DIBLA|nr:unnamed protein product [Dibothriocephalus latus]
MVLLQLLGTSPTTPHEKAALRDLRVAAAATLGIDYGCTLDGDDVDFAFRAPAIDPKVNSVGELQEYCQKNMWPSPVYEFKAKRKAAADFLKAIIDQGLSIPTEELEAIEEDSLPLLEKKDMNSLKDRQSNNEKAAKSVRKLLSGVFTSRGKLPQLNIDSTAVGDKDVYRTLDAILETHKLTISYSIVKSTNSGKLLLSLISALPIRIIYLDILPILTIDPSLYSFVISSLNLDRLFTTLRAVHYLLDKKYALLPSLKTMLCGGRASRYVFYKKRKVYCQAQLSTLPPQVIGSRPFETEEEARKDAAHRCITYLKIMTMPAPRFDDAWFRYYT